MTDKTMQAYAREYAALAAQKKAAEDRMTEIRDRMTEALGHNAKAHFGKWTVTTFDSTRANISGKAVKEKYPEVYADLGHDSTFYSIRVTEGK